MGWRSAHGGLGRDLAPRALVGAVLGAAARGPAGLVAVVIGSEGAVRGAYHLLAPRALVGAVLGAAARGPAGLEAVVIGSEGAVRGAYHLILIILILDADLVILSAALEAGAAHLCPTISRLCTAIGGLFTLGTAATIAEEAQVLYGLAFGWRDGESRNNADDEGKLHDGMLISK